MKTDRCWKTIGVWGNQSPRCELLDELTHCYNCKYYQDAGRDLWDRAQSDADVAEATDVLAQPRLTETQNGDPVMVFTIGGEWFGLPLAICMKVIPPTPVCPVPHRDPWVLEGLVNVGGRLLPCVSLSGLLGIPARKERDKATRPMIVAKLMGQEVVFPVEEIKQPSFTSREDSMDPPGCSVSDSPTLSSRIIPCEGHPVSCLDSTKLRQAIERRLG